MNDKVLTAPVAEWRYEMQECPHGAKCLLLTDHGVAVIGQINGDIRGYRAWSPLPKRNKQIEMEKGYL